MTDNLPQFIQHELENARRILVVSHIRPDGDAVGSLLGLGLALQAADKKVQMVLVDGVPASFKHLPGANQVQRQPTGDFDYTIVLDCSDLERVGNALDEVGKPDLNIDHHVTNLNFARTNLVDTKAVSTTAILTELIPLIGLPLNQESGMALLTGLITDTLGFRTANMTAKAMRIAATLVDLGIDMPTLYFKAQVERSFDAIRFWGKALTGLQRENGMIWATLTIQDRKEVGYPGRDDADLVNVLTTVSDYDIALIFVEQPDGKVKVSWRARPGFDTSKVALSFGGGGHKAASGADVEGSLEEVQERVLVATREIYKMGEYPVIERNQHQYTGKTLSK